MELRYCEKCGDVIRVETDEPLSPTAQFICDGCKAGGGPRASAPATPSGAMHLGQLTENQGLDFFSPDTIAVRKKQLEEEFAAEDSKATHLRFAKSGDPGSQRVPQGGSGAGPLSKSAQKLLFRCLHCRSTLSIRPVEKTSKLNCPHCGGAIYVTPAGKLHKNPPSGPPAAPSLTPQAAPRGESVRLKPASAASRKGGSAAQRMAPTYPEPTAPASGHPFQGGQAMHPSPVLPPAVSASGAQLSGSVRLRLAGSQAVRKPQVVHEPPEGPSPAPAAAPGGPGRQGSVRLRPGSFRSSPGQTIPALEPAPAEHGTSRRVSAFQEHQTRPDPEKTAFITDEATSDLSEVSATTSPKGFGAGDLPAFGSDENVDIADSLASLLPPEDEGPSEPAARRSQGSVHSYNEPPAMSAKRHVPKTGRLRGFATGCLRAAVLIALLAGPVSVVELVSAPAVANAEGFLGAACARAVPVLDRVGDLGFEGLRALFGSR